MKISYNQPEFKVVAVSREDILTASTLNTAFFGFETGTPDGDVTDFIDLD